MTPHIISASRREDIPAWKVDWFLDRIKEGKVEMCSSFAEYEISFEKVQLIVFWTKNPRPLMEHLKEIPFKYYFHYTLNDYPEYELNVPPLNDRIQTFIDLSKMIGKKKLIWRYDPVILNDQISVDDIIKRIKNIGDQIYQYTEKLVFSFVDPYGKLKNQFNSIDNDTQLKIVNELKKLNLSWNLELATCAENNEFEGIEHNKCIDPELVRRICGNKRWISDTKDKTQRKLCGCIQSADIGSFRECEHSCSYCYAK